MVPQPDRFAFAGQPADDWAEECGTGGGFEMDDRRADVLAGERERLIRLGADLGVERGVVRRVSQLEGQPRFGQDRFHKTPGATVITSRNVVGRVRCGVEDVRPESGVKRPDRLPTMLCPRLGGDSQQPQPGRMTGFILGREMGVVVDIGVDHPQRDEPPVHRVVPLRHDKADPFARHPRKRAHRVEIEVDVGFAHRLKANPLRYCATARGAERGATDSTAAL